MGQQPRDNQANPYPGRDAAQAILDAAPNISNRVRATAWDAFYQARDEASFRQAIDPLPLSQETKAALWDEKFGQHPKTAGEHVWEGVKAFGSEINPVPMIDAMGRAIIPQFVGEPLGLGKTGPINALRADMAARGQIWQRGTEAGQQGDLASWLASRIYGSIPFVGPKLDQAGQEMASGEVGAGVGRTLGFSAASMGPAAAANARIRVPAIAGPPKNPVEAAAVQFGESKGIPIDAATATGRRVVGNLQKRATESLGGAGVADEFRQAQAGAFTRVGDELAERANQTRTGRPGPPQSPISAGESVQGRLESRINAQARVADAAYNELRRIEQQRGQTIAQTGGVRAPATSAQPFTNVPLAVDVSAAKTSLRPLYDSLKREAELNIPMQGGKGRTLAALDGLMNGPDMAPLSVVDGALGDLKAMARTGDLPALRTRGQATAAEAVKALEAQVTATARMAGPDVHAALMRGRQATISKYETAAVRDTLSTEPAQLVRQLTANKDVGLERLRAVAQETPREIPKVARAYLEQLMEKATAEGGFGHADALWADWQRLGPETKAILFKDRALIKDLDNFFLLAKRAAANPNPSGTAQVMTALNVGTAPATYTLARMLYSRRGVQALTRGVTLSLSRRGATAAQAGAMGELARVAREFAEQEAVPAVAEDEASPTSSQPRPR